MIVKASGVDLLHQYGLEKRFDFQVRPLDLPDVGESAQAARSTPQFRRVIEYLSSNLEDTPTIRLASHLLPDIPPKDSFEVILSRCLRELFINGYMWGNKKDPSIPLLFSCYDSPIARAVSITDTGKGFNKEEVLEKRKNHEKYWQNQGRGLDLLDNAPFQVTYLLPGNTSILILPLTSRPIGLEYEI